ncbi:MAG: O-antigen ligase family protein, partial [Caldilineaceae bacterium]|nr:O-antigen ligase family protein [Caldilineaceae bacterium]
FVIFIAYRRGQPLWPRSPFNLPLLIFAFMVLIGMVVAPDKELMLSKATALLLGFLIWRFLNVSVNSVETWVFAFWGFLISGVILTLLTIPGTDWHIKFAGFSRLARILPTPLVQPIPGGLQMNMVAGMLMFLLPATFPLIFAHGTRNLASRYLIVLLAFLAVITLIITQSRSGWIAALTTISGFLVVKSIARWAKKLSLRGYFLIASVISLGLLLVAVVIKTGERDVADLAASEYVGTTDTLEFRLEVWRWALASIAEYPYTGSGLGNFRELIFRRYPVSLDSSYDIAHAHNIYLQIALDLGLPGLISYLAWLILSVYFAAKAVSQIPKISPPVESLLLCLVAYHLFGLTDAPATGARPSILLWYLLGLMNSFPRTIDQIR